MYVPKAVIWFSFAVVCKDAELNNTKTVLSSSVVSFSNNCHGSLCLKLHHKSYLVWKSLSGLLCWLCPFSFDNVLLYIIFAFEKIKFVIAKGHALYRLAVTDLVCTLQPFEFSLCLPGALRFSSVCEFDNEPRHLVCNSRVVCLEHCVLSWG